MQGLIIDQISKNKIPRAVLGILKKLLTPQTKKICKKKDLVIVNLVIKDTKFEEYKENLIDSASTLSDLKQRLEILLRIANNQKISMDVHVLKPEHTFTIRPGDNLEKLNDRIDRLIERFMWVEYQKNLKEELNLLEYIPDSELESFSIYHAVQTLVDRVSKYDFKKQGILFKWDRYKLIVRKGDTPETVLKQYFNLVALDQYFSSMEKEKPKTREVDSQENITLTPTEASESFLQKTKLRIKKIYSALDFPKLLALGVGMSVSDYYAFMFGKEMFTQKLNFLKIAILVLSQMLALSAVYSMGRKEGKSYVENKEND